MEIAARFLSLKGRLSRGQYWRHILKLTFCFLVILVLFLILLTKFFPLEIPIAAKTIGVLIMLVVWLSSLSLYVRRLHDRHKSAWWILPFYILPQINASLTVAQYNSPIIIILSIIVSIVGIWGFVEVGLLRGHKGPNTYGADPLENSRTDNAG